MMMLFGSAVSAGWLDLSTVSVLGKPLFQFMLSVQLLSAVFGFLLISDQQDHRR